MNLCPIFDFSSYLVGMVIALSKMKLQNLHLPIFYAGVCERRGSVSERATGPSIPTGGGQGQPYCAPLQPTCCASTAHYSALQAAHLLCCLQPRHCLHDALKGTLLRQGVLDTEKDTLKISSMGLGF